MKTGIITIKFLILILVYLASGNTAILGQENADYKHTIEISPLSPFLKIYAIQYNYLVTDKSELMLGFAYANIEYDEDRSHAPTIILGYRRFLWNGFHLEYQLWPAYNDYFETTEKKYYSGFELWNEFRTGYQFNFSLGNIPFTATPQLLCGFGLWPGNKPDSFIEIMKKEPVFVYPNLFVGIKF
jgi:hypothetical protein